MSAIDSRRDGPAAGARRYQLEKLLAGAFETALFVAGAAALIGTGWAVSLRDVVKSSNTADWSALSLYGLLLFAAMAVATLPVDFYSGYLIERRFGLGRQTVRAWAIDWLKAAGLELVLALALLHVVYGVIGLDPVWWWVYGAAGTTAVTALLAFVAPVLILPIFARFEPLSDYGLRQRIVGLAQRLGVRVRGVYVWKMGDKTRKANAAVSGWGYSRRILIADTLLEGHTAAEVEAVIAHEIGHQVRHDVLRGIAMQSVLAFAGFYVLKVAIDSLSEPLGITGAGDIAGVPLLALVAAFVGLVTLPVVNAFSRSRERAADAYALAVTGQTDAFISAMEKLAARNLADRRPHPLIEFLLHSHPSIDRRIAFAARFKRG